MQVEFVAQSDRNASFPAANSARLINMFAEALPAGSRSGYQLRGVLGQVDFSNVGGVFLRAMEAVGGNLFAASGGNLVQVTISGGTAVLGAIADDGKTLIAGNDGDVTITAGGLYYVWDGATLTTPAAGAFSSFGAHDVLGGYTIITERNGSRFQWSNLFDAKTLDGLNYATAEGRDGPLIRPVVVNGNVLLFKENSYEVWTLSGLANENAFSSLNSVRDIGLKSHRFVARFPNGVFFIGSNNRAYITGGGSETDISTPAVIAAIETGNVSDCFYYEQAGHGFCVIRFHDRPAWVCDITQNMMWHERATGEGAWDAMKCAYFNGSWHVGGQGGFVHRLAPVFADDGAPMLRRAVSLTAANGGQQFTAAKLEFFGNVGEVNIGREPEMMMRLSGDNGKTWGRIRSRGLGGLGEYETRVTFRALGQFRQMTAEITITDPADIRLLSGAEVDLL